MSEQTTKPERKATVAEVVRDLILTHATELVWDGEHAYVVLQTPDHVQTLPVGSRAFRRWIQRTAARQGMSPPSREAIVVAEQSIEGAAEDRSGIQPTPSIRVAGRDGEILIDLGGDDWRCVRVTAEGWAVEPHPVNGPYMYRPPRMAALPTPERGGDVNDLWRFVNVKDPIERVLLTASIVQMLWPRGPYPVLELFGEQGSAKTTAQEVVKSLVDPSRPSPDKHALTSLRKPPRDDRDVTAAAHGARVIAFDNVSYLDEWLSDTLCRLATGADLGGRELYSDHDEAIISVIRPVMFNGIPEVVGKSDLADRAIKVECTPPERRIPEAELWRDFEAARPLILGAFLDLLVVALANYGAPLPAELPDVRMADFARVGEAIGPALGLGPGDFTRMYHQNRTTAARDIAEASSLTGRLEDLLVGRAEPWVGSVGELLIELTSGNLDHGKGWWSSAKALGNELTRQRAPLRAVGVEVSSLSRGRSPISGKVKKLYEVRRSG